MRIQLIIISFLLSLNVFAVDDKSIQDLFKKYDLVMDNKKVELIDEVFSQKFIKDSGGKQELIEKIKELTPPPSPRPTKVTWKEGKGNLILARTQASAVNKSKHQTTTEYIVVIENGKPKIDGTLSDAD